MSKVKRGGIMWLVGLVLLGLFWAAPAQADKFLNSAESGCDGSDPTVLICDDWERGIWATTYADANNPDNYGWEMTPFSVGCGGIGCVPGQTLINNPPTQGAICGGKGVAGTDCAASSGVRSGSNGNYYGEHDYKGATNSTNGYTEVFLRRYMKDLPSVTTIGLEKMLTFNYCCVPAGIRFGMLFSWDGGDPANRNYSFLIVAEDANREYNVSSFACPNNHWCFTEVRIKLNSSPGASDGILQIWADDCGTDGLGCIGTPTLRANHTNVMWREGGNTTQLGSVWLENWSNPETNGESYYDQLKVATTGPIGFAGSEEPPDTTPPSVPTGLQVTELTED